MSTIPGVAVSGLWWILPVDTTAKIEALRDRLPFRRQPRSDETHLRETVAWLCRAHDSSEDAGVARAYKAAAHGGHGVNGWQPSYPETTGYLIPTFFALSEFLHNPDHRGRAIRMADWEIDIQLPSGAVMGSVVTADPRPAVFNTGQVIFGWISAFRQTGSEKYLTAARRAADYLITTQDSDGSWSGSDGSFALPSATTYNIRSAWALVELAQLTRTEAYEAAARRSIDLALSRQQDNGWFSDNCLSDPSRPLLHTIMYAIRGMLEIALLFGEQQLLDAARRPLDALARCQRRDGGMPGRLDSNWRPGASWDCITGDAQAAVSWLRMHAATGEGHYLQAARATLDLVKRSQNLGHRHPGIRGGVKGSYPFDGGYGRFELLNWAAQFFVDALMMIRDPDLAKRGIRG